ncbi:hypothetical protein D8674_037863 [Pyrus ussuriensis x Pyrus communis]|uniref:Uncharacterized protein n=1 Tax=Pyrus ussuriensis x Pyrus communis TaxID=2448454 RepID=A0A5N5HEL3_9ROSA|nr:hypothetical protein D8674_037863 [Pyrus ussuriensis x Pyrus communis]
MADLVLDSTKSCVGEGSHEGKGVLRIESQCLAKFESWTMVPEELKKSMVGELSWKFDVLWDVERGGVPNALANAPEEED